MTNKALDTDFVANFQAEVQQELQIRLGVSTETSPPIIGVNLRKAPHYHINLYPADEDRQRLLELARNCAANQISMSNKLSEWFISAYVAGLAYHCRNINGAVYIRTSVGYEKWEELLREYPLDLLQKKISERRKLYEEARSHGNILLAQQLIETPIILLEIPEEARKHQRAEELVNKKEVQEHLCRALQSISNDVFEVAKIITPILLALTIAGTVSIALAPTVFASIALIISRMGIAAFCDDYVKDKEKRGDPN